jgi:hypothetical protein
MKPNTTTSAANRELNATPLILNRNIVFSP